MIIKNFYWTWEHWLQTDSLVVDSFTAKDLQYIEWENFTDDEQKYIKEMQWDWLKVLWGRLDKKQWLPKEARNKWISTARVFYYYKGQKHSIQELADIAWISYKTMYGRLYRYGYSVNLAVNKDNYV